MTCGFAFAAERAVDEVVRDRRVIRGRPLLSCSGRVVFVACWWARLIASTLTVQWILPSPSACASSA